MIVLLITGTVALIIGGHILIDPVSFYAGTGIGFGNQIALKNELKATGGFLLAVGLLALLAIVITRLRFFALITLGLINGFYGTARMLSFLTDGIPNSTFVWIVVVELALVSGGPAMADIAATQFTGDAVSINPAEPSYFGNFALSYQLPSRVSQRSTPPMDLAVREVKPGLFYVIDGILSE